MFLNSDNTNSNQVNFVEKRPKPPEADLNNSSGDKMSIRQMAVYDYNGRKVQVRRSVRKPDSYNNPDDANFLPPLNSRGMVGSPLPSEQKQTPDPGGYQEKGSSADHLTDDNQSVGKLNNSMNGSSMRTFSRGMSIGSNIRVDGDCNTQRIGDGYLSKSLLSRRVNGDLLYYPDDGKPGKRLVKSETTIPADQEKHYRRYIHDRYGVDPNDFYKNPKYRGKDKAVTFYRSYNSTQPELRLVISDNRFRSMSELIDDLTKILNLSDREKFIHTQDGKILRSLEEFTERGMYFFGPPYMYEVEDYLQFKGKDTLDQEEEDELIKEAQVVHRRKSRHSPTFEDMNKYGLAMQSTTAKDRNKKLIHIIANTDNSKKYTFTLDKFRHRTLMRVIQEINDLVKPEDGAVNILCTRKGRAIQSLGELFHHPEDHFIAVVSKSETQDEARKVLMSEYNTYDRENEEVRFISNY